MVLTGPGFIVVGRSDGQTDNGATLRALQTSSMQRRQRRGKLAECVGNGTKGGNDGADRSELVG